MIEKTNKYMPFSKRSPWPGHLAKGEQARGYLFGYLMRVLYWAILETLTAQALYSGVEQMLSKASMVSRLQLSR